MLYLNWTKLGNKMRIAAVNMLRQLTVNCDEVVEVQGYRGRGYGDGCAVLL